MFSRAIAAEGVGEVWSARASLSPISSDRLECTQARRAPARPFLDFLDDLFPPPRRFGIVSVFRAAAKVTASASDFLPASIFLCPHKIEKTSTESHEILVGAFAAWTSQRPPPRGPDEKAKIAPKTGWNGESTSAAFALLAFVFCRRNPIEDDFGGATAPRRRRLERSRDANFAETASTSLGPSWISSRAPGVQVRRPARDDLAGVSIAMPQAASAANASALASKHVDRARRSRPMASVRRNLVAPRPQRSRADQLILRPVAREYSDRPRTRRMSG